MTSFELKWLDAESPNGGTRLVVKKNGKTTIDEKFGRDDLENARARAIEELKLARFENEGPSDGVSV